MRADIGTTVTLDTVLGIPYRNVYCDTTLLVCSSTGRCGTIYIILECRYRKVVTFLSSYFALNVIYEIYNVFSSAVHSLCDPRPSSARSSSSSPEPEPQQPA